ncbi:metallophosphoesterase [Pleionea mediterranea]|uniref:Calcineurin-like phosphoesterase family protein n=1 Tax=Pleionea mediterranea TaxID=523701 RepID=A0A316FZ70_9GAMM|nr:metallophosphoesterase [Pleionea mediterranea]PWK52840.1 calcineurin-like phosphoesterase family protein [Pleionea mediterranea]
MSLPTLIVSDIHLEFGKFRLKDLPQVELAVLAGDIGIGKGARFLIEQFTNRGIDVIYITGNHEFYGREMNELCEQWRKIASENSHLHFLDKSSATVKGRRIHGTTLWTDFNNQDPELMDYAVVEMNDYKKINLSNVEVAYKHAKQRRQITPDDILKLHYSHVDYLKTNVKPGDVVVTHHAPSHRSIPYANSWEDLGLYSSNLEWLIEETKPSLWIHGHVHSSLDYRIGDTRIICNPRGYIGHYVNSRFDDKLIIEINK